MLLTDDSVFQEYLPLKHISPAKLKVRSYDTNTQIYSIRELALSIKTHGLLQPILVRPVADHFEIIAGHRRYFACKLLRWKKIAVIIKDLSDIEAFEDQIIENIQRRSLNGIEEGQAFNLYVKNYGWGGVTNLANKLTKSEQYVSSRIQLLSLPKYIQDYIIGGDLPISHALELVSLTREHQSAIVNKIIEKNLSVMELRYIKQDPSNIRLVSAISKEISNAQLIDDTADEEIAISFVEHQKLLILKKVKLCLKIALSRMDGLIHSYATLVSNDKLNLNGDDELRSDLMRFRISLHSLLDEDVNLISKLKDR